MTADIPALLQPLKDRLEPALFHAPYRADGRRVIQTSNHPDLKPYVLSSESMPVIAEFIAAAPTDQAKLIAAIEALVGELDAIYRDSRGLGVDFQDDDFERGWHGARREVIHRIRAAITQALGGDTA